MGGSARNALELLLSPGKELTMATPVANRMIELAHVKRSFRRADGQTVNAVNDISFVIPEGEFVCFVGPSGCGKSTLLQILAGLLDPSDGDVVVNGRPISGPGPDRGVVFQKDSVFPWLRVIDNVEYGLKCRGMPAAERREIARLYLRHVGLSHVENAWPRELSGGMLKRVAVATVFANGGRVLMLDEPFGALDYVTRHQLQQVLLDLWNADGGGTRRTVLFVTHDVDEAMAMADRIMVFHNGSKIDDIPIRAGRPRATESLLLPDMVEIKRKLLHHLGLDRPYRAAANPLGASA
jgi:NitT/TauT family transport system ATP-binding protein